MHDAPPDTGERALPLSNKTSLRVTAVTIDRLRTLARAVNLADETDRSWAALGRTLLEHGLAEAEARQRARPAR